MKKIILKGFAGIVAALLAALVYFPISAQAAGEPPVSLTAGYYCTDDGTTFVVFKNNGAWGNSINTLTWNIYEKATDWDTGATRIDYAETRVGLLLPAYVNTENFTPNGNTTVTLVAECPAINYSFTTSFVISNKKEVNAQFSLVPALSGVLYNGQPNSTLDVYSDIVGGMADASFAAFMPAGYMMGTTGTVSFNYTKDYLSKTGAICINIPDGYRASNRTYKLMTLGEGGVVNVCDDCDLNPGTITSFIDFKGYAIALIYAETGAAPTIAATNSVLPTGSTNTTVAFQTALSNYQFVKETHGPLCMATFDAFRPFGYVVVDTYSLYTGGSANISPKNGYVTISVPTGYSSYKLVTVGSNGEVVVYDDVDAAAGTATFALSFSGYACQLIAK